VIDAGEPIVLGKIELTGTNVNRTVAAGITKGGAAIAFSLEGTNDPEGTWTLLRDSSAVTHWYAMTTTTIIGNCYSGLQSTVTITRKPSGGRLWQLTSPQHQSTGEGYNVLAFNGTILGTIGSTLLAWRGTDNQGLTNVTSGYTGVPWTGREYWIDHDPSNVNNWVLNIVLEPTDDPETIINMAGGTVKVIAGEEINTSFRYYKLVPINRSLGRELSFALRRLDLFQRVSASLVSMPGIELTGSLQMAAEVYQSFDHSLTLNGFIGRFTTELYSSGTTLASHTGALNAQVLDTLDQFPTVEVSFDTPHRIRSWSIQSVGDKYYERTGAVFEALATVLVLQGRTLDGRWRVLDLARSADDWYTPDKIRTDRPVQQTEMVDKIRISAVAVQIAPSGNALHGGLVWFPQIQVFAGVPVIPKMVQSDQNGVQVKSNGGEESNVDVGVRVFDRAVSGNGIARIGSRAWYINNNHFLLEDVAENGNVSQFGSYQSKAWLALMFPKTRMFGYLYSIDNLYNRTDIHANVSYAASLYFEGRQIADANATLAPSAQWDFIDLISLDRCIGHNLFGVPTATLIAETGQTTLNNYAASLGLPVLDKTFIMNRTDYHVIRYDAETEKWVDDGLRLEPGTTAALSNQFNEMTTDDLLNQSGQARLNSVALARGESMQPPWSVIPDKATIVNQKDNRRMMYAFATTTWSEVPNNDAIYQVHDQTHYADLKDSSGNPLPLAQLRCTAQSIMNTERPSVGGEPVVMPEVQLFGLPAETINAGAVATVTYLKAEDSAGNLHDILGKHQRLPYQNWWSYYGGSNTAFRLYLGTLQHIKSSDKKLYLAVCNESGQMLTSILGIENSSYPYLEFSVYGDFRTSPTYFELYIYSTNDEKIILSSGY
ncbi:MAG: hypothetical protein FWE95_12105, partial [Planctomycetaceae bacterium]|nr:hypothetical protein [Planctomycetaceae bacterium]